MPQFHQIFLNKNDIIFRLEMVKIRLFHIIHISTNITIFLDLLKKGANNENYHKQKHD